MTERPVFDALSSYRPASESVMRLVAAVANDMACEACVIYRFEYNTLYPVYATAGARAQSLRLSPESPLMAGDVRNAVHVADFTDDSAAPRYLPQLELAAGRKASFVAATPIRRGQDQPLGLLLVADVAPRSGLGVALSCALQIYAGQLAVQFGRWLVRESAGFASEQEQLRVLRTIVDRLSDAIVVMRCHGHALESLRTVYANQALVDGCGFVEHDLIGGSSAAMLGEMVGADGLERVAGALDQSCAVDIACDPAAMDSDTVLELMPVRELGGHCAYWIGVLRRHALDARRLTGETDTATESPAAMFARATDNSLSAIAAESPDIDTLTGLYNRRHILSRIETLIRRRAAGDVDDEVDVLFIDLDGFKPINDTYGHQVGDELLTAIAGRLISCIRSQDTLARLGGDEFLIVVAQGDSGTEDFGVGLARRIIEHLGRPFRVSERQISCGSSIGLSRLADHHRRPEDIIREADEAMYSAKSSGRGGYVRFSEAMRQRSAETVSLRAELQRALDDRHFRLHYQPIMRLDRSGVVHAVEALLRWPHPQRGTVAPGVFIPLAEELGRMSELGSWVVGESCRQMLAWGTLADHCYLCINLSLSELQDPEGVARIKEIVRSSGLPADRVVIEIDEPTLAAQSRLPDSGLAELRALGIRLSVDNFGHDAASLSRLAEYDIDALKIGPSFIARLVESSRASAVVESLLALGRALNIEVIAEGIETRAQFERLREIGCQLGQGRWLTAPDDAPSMAREFSDAARHEPTTETAGTRDQSPRS